MIRTLLCALVCMVALSAHAGVVYNVVAVTESQVQELAESDAARALVLFEGEGPDRLHLDNVWHGVHWLLARFPDSAEVSLSSLFMGGKPVGGGGQARVHAVEEVKSFASLLAAIDIDALTKSPAVVPMDAANVYPVDWAQQPGNLEHLKAYFVELRNFYVRAAKQRKAVLYVWS